MAERRRVVGFPRYMISEDGVVLGRYRNLKPLPYDNGYLRVCLTVGKKDVFKSIHSMVAEAFIGPRPQGFVIDHKDGNPSHNHRSNLHYVSVAENNRLAIERSGNSKRHARGYKRLTLEQINSIRAEISPGDRANGVNALAKKYGVDSATIRYAAQGKHRLLTQTAPDVPADQDGRAGE